MERVQKKDEFRLRIYKYVLVLVKFLAKISNRPVLREIKSQLTRSGTSIGANFFEAQAGSSKKDFQNFFSYSLKSANETKFWLAILRDSNLLEQKESRECNLLLKETQELANILAASIMTMKRKK